MIKVLGEICPMVRGMVGYQIPPANCSMTSRGRAGGRNEEHRTADKGQVRRQNTSEWRRRGWSPAAEARHVGVENIIHHGCNLTALSGLRLSVGGQQECNFVVCSFG
jgi:hypothetical protein